MKGLRLSPPAPAICIGNFVAGGAGKTPVASFVRDVLQERGEAPVILARGYGGALGGGEPIAVDAAVHTAAQVGDEPLLLARRGRVVIGADRSRSARLAVAAGARSLVLDDGFQSAAFEAPALVVVDGMAGLGNGKVLPAGPLRAPLDTQWAFATALLILGEGEAGRALAQEAGRRSIPVFSGELRPEPKIAASLSGKRVFAFAGIGRPEKFYQTLRELGAQVVGRRSFADHRPYSPADLTALVAAARAAKAETLVTTEKDAMRLPDISRSPLAAEDVKALPIHVELQDEGAFRAWISEVLNRQRDVRPV